jgi:hypothetical protein
MSYFKLLSREHDSKVSEIVMDMWNSKNNLNELGKKFINDFWMHYLKTNQNKITRDMVGTIGNDCVIVDILKEDLNLWKTLLVIVATHPRLIKQHKFLFQKPCDKCNDNHKGFSFYKRFKNG